MILLRMLKLHKLQKNQIFIFINYEKYILFTINYFEKNVIEMIIYSSDLKYMTLTKNYHNVKYLQET